MRCTRIALSAFGLALALAAAAPRAARAFTWEPCDAGAAPWVASEVGLEPDPPVIGGPVTFTIKTQADRVVAGGMIGMSVMFVGTPIYEGSDDLCAKTACPIAPGPATITYKQDLPPIAPPGDYDVTLRARDTAGTELLCVTVHFTMVPPPSRVGGGALSPSSSGAVVAAAQHRRNVAPSKRRMLLLA